MNLSRFASHNSVPEPVQDATQRQAAVRVLEATLGRLDAEFHDGRAIRWILGSPLVRLELARDRIQTVAQMLTAAEQGEIGKVLDTHERLFEAVAAAQRDRGTVSAGDPLVLSPELRRELESARGATQTLFERLAGWDCDPRQDFL